MSRNHDRLSERHLWKFIQSHLRAAETWPQDGDAQVDCRRVAKIFHAKRTTAVSSTMADHGRSFHAISPVTFIRQRFERDAQRTAEIQEQQRPNINRGLHSTRIPQNAGRIRCPIAKTITATKPTVSA